MKAGVRRNDPDDPAFLFVYQTEIINPRSGQHRKLSIQSTYRKAMGAVIKGYGRSYQEVVRYHRRLGAKMQ